MGILKFLGRGSAFNTKEGNTSAYIKKEENLLMIDCGENIFDRIKQRNLLEGVKHIFVMITHLHPDHVGSLGSLIFYCYHMKNMKVHVRYEKVDDLEKLLRLQGVTHEKYTISSCGENFRVGSLNIAKIESCEVKHTENLNSFAYKIRFYDGKHIFYSGDTNEITSEGINDLKNGYYDEFYIDTCLADYGGNVHLSLRKLCELIPKIVRHKIYCMHYDCDELIEKIREEGFNIVHVE